MSTKFGSEMRMKPQWMYGAGAFIGILHRTGGYQARVSALFAPRRQGPTSPNRGTYGTCGCDQWTPPQTTYHSRVLIHDRYGFVLTVVAAIGAVAAIASLVRPRILPWVRVYAQAMIALVAVQVALGLLLVATGDRPQQLIHWFYGAATLLTLPLALLIGKRLGGREEQIWLAGGAVMTLLFALRALATG
jgi:hypothetical protein